MMEKKKNHCWRLFLRTYSFLVQKMEKDLEEANMRPLPWIEVLAVIDDAPIKALRMSEIAEQVVLSRSGLTRLVDRLEDKGYLERICCPKDKRGMYAQITKKGGKALKDSGSIYRESILEHFSKHLKAEESAHLEKILNRLLQS
jgi:DNA-binding MarR family transcriptional regulator